MTKVFDEKARLNLLQSYSKPDLSNFNVKDLVVKEITCKEARGYIASFHYSHTMPDSSLYVYGIFANNYLCGVCVYGMGCGKNQYLAVWPNAVNGQYIELTRLWLEDTLPKNSESYFIAKTLKMLPKEIKLVISFSDSSKGHMGCIYQATHFEYLGVNNGGKMLVTDDGIEKHPRLLGMYRKRHPEYKKLTNDELMELLHFTYKEGGKKHRYVYIRDKKLKKQLNLKTLPYPKGDKNLYNPEADNNEFLWRHHQESEV